MTGIRTSMSTTSGRDRAASVDGRATVAGLPDELEVGLGLDEHADAGAEERLVVDEARRGCALMPAPRGCAGTRAARGTRRRRPPRRRSVPPASWARSRMPGMPCRTPAVDRPTPRHPVARRSRASSVDAGAVPVELELDRARRMSPWRSAFVSALLHDAVHRDLVAGAERQAVAASRRSDVEPGGAHLVDEAVEVVENGLRRVALVVAEFGEQHAHVAERFAGDARDRAERARRPPRVARRGEAGAVGLGDHDRERVRDHVVHVARDAVALLLDDVAVLGVLALAVRDLPRRRSSRASRTVRTRRPNVQASTEHGDGCRRTGCAHMGTARACRRPTKRRAVESGLTTER